MAASKHLKPVRSKEEASELGKKGGIASGIARRKKRDLKERISTLMFSKVANQELKAEIKTAVGVDVDDNLDVLVAALYQKAISGDVNASIKILEISGILDPQKLEIAGVVAVAEYKDRTTEELKQELARYEQHPTEV